MDEQTIANVIAAYLDDRDDVASADTGPTDHRYAEVLVNTQGGERYLVTIEKLPA